jgi:hypothetical protein
MNMEDIITPSEYSKCQERKEHKASTACQQHKQNMYRHNVQVTKQNSQ